MLNPMTEGQRAAKAVAESAGAGAGRCGHPSLGAPRLRALPEPAPGLRVSVFARDAVLRAGILAQLRECPDVAGSGKLIVKTGCVLVG